MHKREPVKDTCPSIDKCIEQIKSVIYKSEEWISNTVWLMDKIIETLEELRDSNSKLREWGCNEADRVDELEEKVDELEEKIYELKG